MDVPAEALPDIVCSVCKNSLSIFPINASLTENVVICGRCSGKSNVDTSQRQVTYESIARHLHFPCQYAKEGCIEKIKPEHMSIHEKYCRYKPCSCPIIVRSKCTWRGTSMELLDHYKESHRMFIIHASSGFRFYLESDFQQNYLLLFENQLITVKLSYIKYKGELLLIVKYADASKQQDDYYYLFDLLNSKDGTIMHSVAPTKLHKPTTINIKKIGQRPCTVLLGKISIQKPMQISSEDAISCTENENMLESLECPVCYQYMMPPIMICEAGHSFCGPCRENIETCPICRVTLRNTRNYALENLTQFILYPCRYRYLSCDFTGKFKEMKFHEDECQYRNYPCPINNCEFSDVLAVLKAHVQEQHSSEIFKDELKTKWSMKSRSKCEYVCYCFDNIFKLCVNRIGSDFFWSLHLYGPNEECSTYMFELDMVSCDDKEKIFIRKICAPLVKIGRYYGSNYPIIQVKEKSIQNYIINDTFSFNIRIINK